MTNLPTTLQKTDSRPDAARYVTMRDSFLSGWGRAGKKDAVYVYLCDSQEQAEKVFAYAASRGDQNEIAITMFFPLINWENSIVKICTPENAVAWYTSDPLPPKVDEECNGWTNWDTWNFMLWVDSDSDYARRLNRLLSKTSWPMDAERAKYILHMVVGHKTPDGAQLNRVDFAACARWWTSSHNLGD